MIFVVFYEYKGVKTGFVVNTTNRLEALVKATYKFFGHSKSWAFKMTTVSNSKPLISNVVPKHLP